MYKSISQYNQEYYQQESQQQSQQQQYGEQYGEQYEEQYGEQQEYGSQQYNAFDKQIWGPKTWDIMHTFSYNYSVDPTLQMKQNAFNFYTLCKRACPFRECLSSY